jgi:hypothetical protein
MAALPKVTSSGMVLDDANSSSTLLASSGVFTGEWMDAQGFDSVVIALKTDQNGTISIQFSPDRNNVDSTLTRYYRTGQIEAPHRFTITRKFYRVVVTNTSASDQTYMRLQTTIGDKANLNAPADGTLSQDFDATLVRTTNYNSEVALGKRQGAKTWTKWGYNADVDNAAEEMIWSVGGDMTFLDSASTMSFVSSSTADDVGGTGATGVVVYGIDANRKEQIEVVFLDGTTPVVTTSTWLGINRMSVYACGSGKENAGNITATSVTGSYLQAEIPAGEGSTQQAIFFTQDEWQALIDDIKLNVVKISGGGGSPVVTVKLWVFSFVSNAKYEVWRSSIDTAIENTYNMDFQHPLIVGEKSVVYATADTDTNNTVVSLRFSLNEYRDADATS